MHLPSATKGPKTSQRYVLLLIYNCVPSPCTAFSVVVFLTLLVSRSLSSVPETQLGPHLLCSSESQVTVTTQESSLADEWQFLWFL